MSLFEVDEAANLIFDEVGEQANIIMGAVIDETMGDEIRVTVIATGFNHDADLKFDRKETQPARVYRPTVPVAEATQKEEITIEAPVQDFEEPKISPRVETFDDREKLEVPTYERQQAESEDVIMHFSDDLSVPTYIRRQEGMSL